MPSARCESRNGRPTLDESFVDGRPEVLNRLCAISAACALALPLSAAWAQSCPAGTAAVTGGTLERPNAAGGGLRSFIADATVCVSRGQDRWQEYHAPGGDLIDYKQGPKHPVDPSKKIGTWTVLEKGVLQSVSRDTRDAAERVRQGVAVLRHTYGTTSYDFAVCMAAQGRRSAPPAYVLTSASGETFRNVVILRGQQLCP